MMYFQSPSSHTAFKSLYLYGLLCVILYANLLKAAAEPYKHPGVTFHCSAPTLLETLAPPEDLCALVPLECPSKHHARLVPHPQTPRVAELNETTLEKALDLMHSSNGTYMAVLYYATWCPFSEKLRPVYDVLSTKFSSVHHVAVEESSVRPSVLSQYGVHSFPILFMHSRTSRVRYYGPRTLENFISFYQNYTGLRATEGRPTRGEDCAFARLVFNAGNETKEVCPYPWAISPEKWLQDDTYLKLAITFLALRLIYIVVPILVSRVKMHWERRINQGIVPLRANYPVSSFEQSPLLGSSSQFVGDPDAAKLGARTASGVGSISVPGSLPPARQIAPSSSLAIAESSSSRAGATVDEVHDVGRNQNVDLSCLHRGTWRS